jgi:hypothetical protein
VVIIYDVVDMKNEEGEVEMREKHNSDEGNHGTEAKGMYPTSIKI